MCDFLSQIGSKLLLVSLVNVVVFRNVLIPQRTDQDRGRRKDENDDDAAAAVRAVVAVRRVPVGRRVRVERRLHTLTLQISKYLKLATETATVMNEALTWWGFSTKDF